MRSLYLQLDSIYKTNTTPEQKLEQKARCISEYKSNVEKHYDNLFSTDAYHALQKAQINNAYIMARMTYTRDLAIFYELYRKNGKNIHATIAQLKTLGKVKGDPKKYLRDHLL